MSFSTANSLTTTKDTIPNKYSITLTSRGWEIFEDGKAWNVYYPTFFEAYSTLKAIHIILSDLVDLTKNI